MPRARRAASYVLLTLLAGCAAGERHAMAPAMEAAPPPPPPAPVKTPDAVLAAPSGGAPPAERVEAAFGPAPGTVESPASAPPAAPPAPVTAEAVDELDRAPAPRALESEASRRTTAAPRAQAARPPKADDGSSVAEAPADDDAASGAARLRASPAPTVLPDSGPRGASVGGARIRASAVLTTGDRTLRPRAVQVESRIQGARARTAMIYVFENTSQRPLEGEFEASLPADATLAGFEERSPADPDEARSARAGGYVDRPLLSWAPKVARPGAPPKHDALRWSAPVRAALAPDVEARRAVAAAQRAGRPYALAEWSGGQTVTMRIHAVPAASVRYVRLEYEAPLSYDGREVRYPVPLPAGATLKQRQATVWVDRRHGEVAAVPVDTGRVEEGRWQRLELDDPPAGAAILVRARPEQVVLRGRDDVVGETFSAAVRPNLPRGRLGATGRAIFAVDTSFSEAGGGAARRAALLEALLRDDPSLEQYAVLLFDVHARWLHGARWRDRSDDNVAATVRELEETYPEGATRLEAIGEALTRQRAWAVDEAPTTVFLLTDGQATWGEDRASALLARYPALRAVRLVAFRFDADRAQGGLLDALVSQTGGALVSVPTVADVRAAAEAHRRRPAELVSVEVEGAPAADVLVRGAPRALFAGQTLRVAGRLPRGGEASLRVTWRVAGKQESLQVPLAGAGDEFAPSAWADAYAQHVWMQRAADRDPARDRLLFAVAQRFGLANPRASFVTGAAPAPVDLRAAMRAPPSSARARRAAAGLAADDLPEASQSCLQALRRAADGPGPPSAGLVWAPRGGGAGRTAAERAYRAARDRDPEDRRLYGQIARTRALAGDSAGAVRAVSTPVEVRPRDASALRAAGYAILALGHSALAAEVFGRLRRLRPFEPPAFLEEALALEAAGRFDEAAVRYERVLQPAAPTPAAVAGPRAPTPSQRAAARLYARLLSAHAAVPEAAARRAALGAAYPEAVLDPDLRVLAHWSRDRVDVDLWVYEPSGQKVRPGAPAGDGRLPWNEAAGLGPEIYELPEAVPGRYDVLALYRSLDAPIGRAPISLLVVVDRKGAPRRFLHRVLRSPEALLMLRTEAF